MKSPKPNTAGLAKYERRGGKVCRVCTSPYRKFIEQAIAGGYSKPAVRKYLSDEFGAKLPINIGYHFIAGHHLNGNKEVAQSK